MKAVNKGYTDTPISGVTALELNRGLVNFGKDFRVQQNAAGESIVVNITTPPDRLEKFRWAAKENTNIYKSSGINPALQAPYITGVDLVTGLSEIWSVTDSTDPAYRYDLPIKGHLVLSIASDELITADDVLAFVGRLVSGLYDTGSEASTRLKSLLRGSLTPSDL